ncbi:putative glycosyl transferase, family 14, Phosphofructokinase superfamily [Helianthus debilis subsp. tardiflorus]
MITKANLVTYRGPTMVANTLHAAAMLLRDGGDWDWFINLSASDYPLVTQDDLIYVFSSLPRDVNFIDHTSNIGWKDPKEVHFRPAGPKEKVYFTWVNVRAYIVTCGGLCPGINIVIT